MLTSFEGGFITAPPSDAPFTRLQQRIKGKNHHPPFFDINGKMSPFREAVSVSVM
jgi:hypothetical protein